MTLGLWVILAVVLAVIEILTVGFFFFFFSLGAVCAAITAIFTDDTGIQVAVFLGTALLFLTFGRRWVMNTLKVSGKPVATNASKLAGERVIVLETVSRYGGRVKVLHTGEVWSAYLQAHEANETAEIPEGKEAVVVNVNGAKLEVNPA